jgi:hypothetical protein
MKTLSKISIIGLTLGLLLAVGCGSSPQSDVTAGSESQLNATTTLAPTCHNPHRITCDVNKDTSEVEFWRHYCSTTVLPLYPTLCGRTHTVELKTCICNFADTFTPICVPAAYTYLSCIRRVNNFVCLDSDLEGNTGFFPWIGTEECLAEQEVMFSPCSN